MMCMVTPHPPHHVLVVHPSEGCDDTGQLLAAGRVQQEARDADFESGQRRQAEGIHSDLERGEASRCQHSSEKLQEKRGQDRPLKRGFCDVHYVPYVQLKYCVGGRGGDCYRPSGSGPCS